MLMNDKYGKSILYDILELPFFERKECDEVLKRAS
jgi:hypothetical protein